MSRIENYLTFILCILLVILPISVMGYNKGVQEITTFYSRDTIPVFSLKKDSQGVYIVEEEIDLNGKVCIIPRGVTLWFTDNGYMHNGRIALQDSTTVVNGRFVNDGALTYHREVVGGQSVNYCMSVSVIDSRSVKLCNCRFESVMDIDPSSNYGLFVYGTEGKGCADVIVDSCVFNGCCMGFFSNTTNCQLSNSHFINTSQFLSIETLYDKGVDYFMAPSGIKVNNNTFICKDSNPSLHPIWCSGFDSISFQNNYFETDCTMLLLYCGDLNIGAENAIVEDCTFVVKGSTPKKKNVVCIECMGRSYPFMKMDLSFGNVVIRSNNFTCMDDADKKDSLSTCRAISSRYFNNIDISNNDFEGFLEAISFSDSFKGIHKPTTKASVCYNSFKNNDRTIATNMILKDNHKVAEIMSIKVLGNKLITQ